MVIWSATMGLLQKSYLNMMQRLHNKVLPYVRNSDLHHETKLRTETP